MTARYKEQLKGALPESYEPLAVPGPPERDHVWKYKDGVFPKNLILKVTGAGGRIWQFEKIQMRKLQRRRIGDAKLITLQEARLKTLEMARTVDAGGVLPTVDEKNAELVKLRITIGNCFDAYYRGHAARYCRTHEEMDRDVERHWEPIIKIQAANLKRTTVRRWFDDLANSKGVYVANKQLKILRACMRWCQSHGIITLSEDPLFGVKCLPEEVHTEHLKVDDLSKLGAALEPESQDVQDIIWLLLWTGQRTSNVLSMEWQELDLNARVWTIPARKTKSKRQYNVALTPNAIAILQRRTVLIGQPFVFPAVISSKIGHLHRPTKAWHRIRARAGLTNLRLHSLRHTAGTWLAANGANAFEIQEALQHASIKTSQRYVHLATEHVRSKMADAQASVMQQAGLSSWNASVEEETEVVQAGSERNDTKAIKPQETVIQVVGYVRKRARPLSAVGVDGRGRVLRGYVQAVQ